MAERKVINKYYPPDFDPAAIPRRRMPKDQQVKVRLMTPFSMRCETCGDYIYKGKKFNARKELADGEDYLGIKIFRFYIKCPKCAAEITFKTDPKNADYLAEHGAVRNFEPWREEKITGEDTKLERELEEENDPMKALENRTVDSKREMDILDALDEIRTRNARNERLNAAVLDPLAKIPVPLDDGDISALVDEEIQAQAKDERLARAIFHTADNGDNVKRLDDEESSNATTPNTGPNGNPFAALALPTKKRKKTTNESLEKYGVVIKKKTASSSAKELAPNKRPAVKPSSVLNGSLPKQVKPDTPSPSVLSGCYDSSSDNSEG